MRKAVELWTEAAELGSIQAAFNLGVVYCSGDGVKQDMVKGIQFYEKAAMQGCVESRHNLGRCEMNKGDFDRALKHLLISAKMGHIESLEVIKRMFMKSIATKEQYTHALKGYQDSVEEMNSHDRDEVKRFRV